jgi:outer membrane autotransporter protein
MQYNKKTKLLTAGAVAALLTAVVPNAAMADNVTSALTAAQVTTGTTAGLVVGSGGSIIITGAGVAVTLNDADLADNVLNLQAAGGNVTTDTGNTVNISANSTSITVGAGKLLSGTGAASKAINTTGDFYITTISNAGTISSTTLGTAIDLALNTAAGTGTTVTNSAGAAITGAVTLSGLADTLNNAGVITGAVNLGAGANIVNITGTTSTQIVGALTGGAGVDTLNINLTAGTDNFDTDGAIDLAGGNDVINIDQGILLAEHSISNNESIVIDTGELRVNGVGITVSGNITQGTAATVQTITITEGTVSGTISTGDGDDVFNIAATGGNANVSGAIDAGTGTDTLNITGSSGTFDTDATITGIENIVIANGANVDIQHAVTGVTTTTIGNGSTLTVSAGSLDGAIAEGTANQVQNLTVSGGTLSANVNLGDNSDVITVSGGTVSGNLLAGAGTDTFNISGGTISGTVDAGAGADTINLTGGTITSINGGTEIDTIAVGNATVTLGTITNVELITVTGAAAKLIVNSAVTGVTGTTINTAGSELEINSASYSGTVTGDGNANILDLNAATLTGAIDLAGGDDTLEINGTGVTSSLTGGAGTDIFKVDGNFTTASTHSITGFETLQVAGAGTTFTIGHTITGGATLDSAASTITKVNESLSLSGNLTFNGTIETANGKTLTASALSAAAGAASVYKPTIKSGVTNAGLSLTTGGSFATTTITPIVDATSAKIANNTTFKIVDVTGATAATIPTAAVVDNYFLYNFSVAQDTVDTKDINLVVTSSTYNAAQGVEANASTAGLSAMLDGLTLSTTTTDFQNFVNNQVNTQTTAEGINDKLEEITGGSLNSSAADASTAAVNSVINVVDTRIGGLSAPAVSGVSSGEGSYTKGVWVQGFGSSISQDKKDGIDGYDATVGGAAFGADTQELIDGSIIGLALSYANANVDSDSGGNGESDIDSYQVSLYSSTDLGDNTFINGLLAGAFNQNDQERTVTGTGKVKADFDSMQYTAKAELGRDYIVGSTLLTPSIIAQYSHFDADSYTETGGGGFNQTVESDSQNSLRFGVGAQASWKFPSDETLSFMPKVSARYFYEALDDEYQATSRLAAGGAAFKVTGPEVARHAVELGAGLDVLSGDDFTLSVDYNADLKEEYVGHTGIVTARWKF